MKKYLAFSIFSALVIINPSVVAASDSSADTDQIRSLLAQVVKLQQKLQDLKTVRISNSTVAIQDITVVPSLLKRTLVQGMRGNDVRILQKFLSSQYQSFTTDYITGFFGSITLSAVTLWQREHGLPAIGIVGPLTRAAISRVIVATSITIVSDQTSGNGTVSSTTVTSGGGGDGGSFSCPSPNAPQCLSGTQTLGVDSNGCNRGYECVVLSDNSCDWNGQKIASGQTVNAYASPVVPFGVLCMSETRTCSRGVISGSYAYNSCTVSTLGNHSPVSGFDLVAQDTFGRNYLSGWAFDPDASSTSLLMQVWKGGSVLCNDTSAAQSTALNSIFEITGLHRFNCYLPQSDVTGTYHMYAIDSNTGTTTEVRNSPMTLTDGASCSLDGAVIPNGFQKNFFSTRTALAPATCNAVLQARNCINGTLSGAALYSYASCVNASSTPSVLKDIFPIDAPIRQWTLIARADAASTSPPIQMQIQNETIGPAEYIDWYSNGPNQKGKPPGSRNGEQYHMCIAPNGTWVWFDQYLDDQPGQKLVKHAVSSAKIIFTPSSGAPVDLISDGTYAACGSAGQPYLLLSGAPWDYRLQVWGYLTNNTKDLNYWDETVTGPTATVDDCLRPAFTFSAAIRKEAYWSNTVPLRWTLGTGTVDTKGIPDGLKVTYGRTTWDGAGMPYMKILSAKAPVNGGWCVASVVDK